ncbi:MAG TPA: hypothetical protein IAB94_00730 [Candidatus Coproplasma avicola]|uniref:Uncharacterized protein n=1 Tax=Candidatus Coproplasma avicola TaxID=2840744 RepID=A0A9D1E5P6_9FIRM|nr:hypothetical protein [Candidatus Coproplasma avicola]
MKKIFSVILCAITALCLCFTFAACGGQQNEQNGQTKYDVSIRVACSDGEVYEFPVGEDEKHITIPYDGVERTYWVKEYNLPDHPRYSDDWFSPSGEGANVFGRTMTYCPPGGLNQSYTGPVKEIGKYCVTIYADSTSDLWYFRSIYLFVTVE